jgi:phage shock protein E
MSRRLSVMLVAGLLAITGAAGCASGSGGSVSVTAGATATTAPASGAELDAAAFAAALKRPGTTILDVRTPAEFASGHLAGARNLDIESPDFAAGLAQLPKDAPYAVYCRSGNRSGQAIAAMQALGFTQAYHLGGGIGAWTSAGGSVVTG